MKRIDELRKNAALCRNTASVRTNGSTSANRVLIRLAETLEHDAATIERLFTQGESISQDGLLDVFTKDASRGRTHISMTT